MNKLLLLGIIGIVLLAGCQSEDATNSTLSSPNVSLTDFRDCQEAGSWQEYLNNTDGAYNADAGFADLYNLSAIDAPLEKNLAEAEVYSIPRGRAGGDVLTDPFLKIDTLYCPFTEKNAQVLFRPITRPAEALNYTRFMQITLAGSQYGRGHRVIMDKAAYDELRCQDVNTSELSGSERRVTSVEAVEDGFRVDLVTYTRAGTMGVYKRTSTVRTDGVMDTAGERELILECGQGMLY